jgi:hypothetical protein
MQDFVLTQTQIVSTASTQTWFVELTQRDVADPLILRLECTTDGGLESCEKTFTMPDLARLPHGEATLSDSGSRAEAHEGAFWITEVIPANDGLSFRVAGRVDVLRFQRPNEVIQLDEGTFDVVATTP